MDLIIRRSSIGTKAEREETLAEAINVGDVHVVLYQRSEIALADLLTAHLQPREALALAQDLRQFVQQATRHSLWHDYRSRLAPADARAIGLVAAWYERAGAAGCRTWADLRDEGTLTPPRSQSHSLRLLSSETAGKPSGADTPPLAVANATMDDPVDSEGSGGIMPTWLQAPDTSIWRR